MAELTTAWMLGCVCGFFMGVTVAGSRKSMSGGSLDRHSLIFNEGRTIRGNGNGSDGPTTPKPNIIPKPQFPPSRLIRKDFLP